MNDDRQLSRLAEARRRQHVAQQAHRVTREELDAATAELTTAASALAERVRVAGMTTSHHPKEHR